MTGWENAEDAERYGRGLLVGAITMLRPLREEDIPTLERWWNDPAVGLLQHATVRPQPAGAVAEVFGQWSANKDSTAVGFSVAAHDDAQLLGHAALYGAGAASRSATLGILIGPQHTGRGYGTDALRVLVAYGFDEMGLHRIGLEVWAYNSRAIATYRGLGFTEEGRRRDAVLHAGAFHDAVLMGLLEDEWRAAGRA